MTAERYENIEVMTVGDLKAMLDLLDDSCEILEIDLERRNIRYANNLKAPEPKKTLDEILDAADPHGGVIPEFGITYKGGGLGIEVNGRTYLAETDALDRKLVNIRVFTDSGSSVTLSFRDGAKYPWVAYHIHKAVTGVDPYEEYVKA